MKLSILLLILTFSVCGASQAAPNGAQCFSVIVKPGGWPIPAHGPWLAMKLMPFGKDREDVEAVSYKTVHCFGLPFYYKSEAGDLALQFFCFHTRALYALELNGARFGHGAIVEGQGIGLASSVYWLDVDEDGVFGRIVCGSNEKLEIPQSVLNKKKSDALVAHR